MDITLRKLEIFVKVAEVEHVTRAGEALLLTQSAVSMALAALEKQAGGRLFRRQGRGLVLSDRGRLLLPAAKDLLRRAQSFEDLLQESSDEPLGALRIGASTTIGNYLLPSIMAEFSRLYPKTQTLLQVGNTEQIERDVDAGTLDLGLIEGPCHRETLTALRWRDDELVVLAGPDHAWAKKGRVSMSMLSKGDWIMREKGSGTREVFEAALASARTRGGTLASFRTSLELGHTEAIKKAVEAGMGVSCLSRLAVARELEHGWLVEVDTPLALERPLTIIVRNDGYRSRLLDACLELLHANARQQPL